MPGEIIAELRRLRAEFADRCNHDLDAMFRYFKEREPQSGRRYVNLTKKPKKRQSLRSRTWVRRLYCRLIPAPHQPWNTRHEENPFAFPYPPSGKLAATAGRGGHARQTTAR